MLWLEMCFGGWSVGQAIRLARSGGNTSFPVCSLSTSIQAPPSCPLMALGPSIREGRCFDMVSSTTALHVQGGEQGDLLMFLLFSLGQHRAMVAVQASLLEGGTIVCLFG